MPKRLGELEKLLNVRGVTIEKPNKGSHWKVKLRDGRTYPLPAHNGLRSEVEDVYLRKLEKLLGLEKGALG